MHLKQAQVGYFEDSGVHRNADMPYASLAFIHAHGHLYGYAQRNVFTYMKPVVGGMNTQKLFLKSVLSKHFGLTSRVTLGMAMDAIGRKYMMDGRAVFGNTSYLVKTSNPTPLVIDGDLRDNFAYKTTVNYKLRKA